jgi:putative flippase GtrA
MKVARSFIAFAVAGAIGFGIEAVVLTSLMVSAGWDALPARGVSLPLAATTTWLLNRRFAFVGRGTYGAADEYMRYLAIQIAGACSNLAVFAACLRLSPPLAAWPAVPLAAGAAFALAFNFLVARAALYGRDRDTGRETARW